MPLLGGNRHCRPSTKVWLFYANRLCQNQDISSKDRATSATHRPNCALWTLPRSYVNPSIKKMYMFEDGGNAGACRCTHIGQRLRI